jgi:hypothetical protein
MSEVIRVVVTSTTPAKDKDIQLVIIMGHTVVAATARAVVCRNFLFFLSNVYMAHHLGDATSGRVSVIGHGSYAKIVLDCDGEDFVSVCKIKLEPCIFV